MSNLIIQATEMTQDIHDGIKELIEKAGWMDLHTTASALEKLSKMLNIVGYAKEYQTDLSLISKNYDDVRYLCACVYMYTDICTDTQRELVR